MTHTYLLQGLALGFGSGISPGPFLALVIAASLRGGFRNGAVVALSPLITDLPIILVCISVLSRVPARGIAALSLLGAGVLLWYAYESVRDARSTSLSELRSGAAAVQPVRHALRQGVLANAVNPNPWMFWITIGAPLLTQSWEVSPLASAAFLTPFYALLVGSKVAIAAAIGASRSRLTDNGYRVLLLTAAVVLTGLALSLARTGISAFVG